MNRIEHALLTCMDALEGHEYVINLLSALRTLPDCDDNADNTASTDDDKAAGAARRLIYGESVCYGIGNFAPTTATIATARTHHVSYSAPMLQLALALVIRRHLAVDAESASICTGTSPSPSTSEPMPGGSDTNEHNIISGDVDFDKHQGIVKMVYFEPLMTQLERVLLEDVFHVEIIRHNERGKRSITTSTTETCKAITDNDRPDKIMSSTLFYMPHCPMRLYGNVLWSNWFPDALCHGRTVIWQRLPHLR